MTALVTTTRCSSGVALLLLLHLLCLTTFWRLSRFHPKAVLEHRVLMQMEQSEQQE
jgi:hypothetical protein